jgi:peptidoglycan/xylan/chitin deacetylase (PgdA/CDA1 family)
VSKSMRFLVPFFSLVIFLTGTLSLTSFIVFGSNGNGNVEQPSPSDDARSDGSGDAISVNDRNGNNKYAILTFDDGWKSQYTNTKPILDKYGFKGTFYIICEDVGKEDHMTWEEINTLQKEGHDLGAHTMTHRDLTDMPQEEMEFEVVESKQCLLENGITDVKSFAYPRNVGSDDKNIVETVAKNYEIARSATDPLMFLRCDGFDGGQQDCRTFDENGELTEVNRYTIMGWSHDSDRVDESLDDSQMLQKFIEVVESQTEYNKGQTDAIPIVIYHKIEDSGDDYATNIDLFEQEMKYLHDNGFTVLDMRDLGYDENTNYFYIKD